MIEKVKPVNPHFEDFLFDWNQKLQFLVRRLWVLEELSCGAQDSS